MSRPLFDGTEESENPTTAFIGKSLVAQGLDAKVEGKGSTLSAMKPWPVRTVNDPARIWADPDSFRGVLLEWAKWRVTTFA